MRFYVAGHLRHAKFASRLHFTARIVPHPGVFFPRQWRLNLPPDTRTARHMTSPVMSVPEHSRLCDCLNDEAIGTGLDSTPGTHRLHTLGNGVILGVILDLALWENLGPLHKPNRQHIGVLDERNDPWHAPEFIVSAWLLSVTVP